MLSVQARIWELEDILVKSSPVDSHHDPSVWQQEIRLLKSLDILVSVQQFLVFCKSQALRYEL
jgi:hypothetical protein